MVVAVIVDWLLIFHIGPTVTELRYSVVDMHCFNEKPELYILMAKKSTIGGNYSTTYVFDSITKKTRLVNALACKVGYNVPE